MEAPANRSRASSESLEISPSLCQKSVTEKQLVKSRREPQPPVVSGSEHAVRRATTEESSSADEQEHQRCSAAFSEGLRRFGLINVAAAAPPEREMNRKKSDDG